MAIYALCSPLLAQADILQRCETEFANEQYRAVIELAAPAAQECLVEGQKTEAMRLFQMASMSGYFLGDDKIFRSAGRQARLLEAELATDPVVAELALANAAILGNERQKALDLVDQLKTRIPFQDPQRFRLGLMMIQSLNQPSEVPDVISRVRQEVSTLEQAGNPKALQNAGLTALFLSEWLEHLAGDSAMAKEFGVKALNLHRQVNLQSHPMASTNILSRVFAAGHHPKEAIEARLKEDSASFRTSSRMLYTRYAFLAYQYETSGQTEQALKFYRQAIQETEKTWSSVQSTTDLENSAASGLPYSVPQPSTILRRAALLLRQMDRQDEAFELLERFKSRSLLVLMSDIVSKAQSLAPQEVKDSYSSQLQALKTADIRGKVDPENVEEFTRTQALLAEKDPRFEDLTQVRSTSLQKLRDSLDEKTTVVSYHCSPHQTLVCLVDQTSIRFETLDLSQTALRTQITQAGRRLRMARPNLDAKTKLELNRLHKILIEPLKLADGTDLIILPSGPLHYVPFAALIDDRDRFLVENHTLTHSPSALIWLQTKGLLGLKKFGGEESRVYSLGDYRPAYGSYTSLPGTLREAQVVASKLGAKHQNAVELTKANVIEGLKSSDILHIATHGDFNPQDPLKSQLILADEALSAEEIFGLKASARLLVASACQTGLGVVLKGDEVIGLSRAFLHAGVPTQVLSLWSIDDERTADFMELFYSALKSGSSEAQALQVAQKEFLNNDKLPDHPYYWAPFVLNGASGYRESPLLREIAR